MTKPVFELMLNHLGVDGVHYPTLSERGYDAAEVFDLLKRRVIGHGWIKPDPDRESAKEYFIRAAKEQKAAREFAEVLEKQVEAEGPPEPTHPSPLDLQDLDKWFEDQDEAMALVQAVAIAATEAIAKLVRAERIKRLEAELHQLKHFPKGPAA
jgi:hypothetical protein